MPAWSEKEKRIIDCIVRSLRFSASLFEKLVKEEKGEKKQPSRLS